VLVALLSLQAMMIFFGGSNKNRGASVKVYTSHLPKRKKKAAVMSLAQQNEGVEEEAMQPRLQWELC